MINSNIFDFNLFFVDEKAKFFKFENSYQVFNDQGELIGNIKQQLSTGQKISRVFFKKRHLPFLLEIKDLNNQTVATISRGWTFFMSTITIQDQQEQIIATIQQKFKVLGSTFKLFRASGAPLAEITGNWASWDFSIKNEEGAPIGIINKKWTHASRELFTTADKYMVEIYQLNLDREAKAAILATALCVDMIFKET